MNEPTDLDARATTVANRLRMLQAEVAASADDETRLVLLSDGLTREVQGVPPESRARFVGLLLEHFGSRGGPAGAAVATGASGAAAPAPLTALQHAEALAEAWPKLSDAERAPIEARLRAAGISRPAPVAAPTPPPAPVSPPPAPAVAAVVGTPVAPAGAEAWRRAIQAAPGDALDPARLGELGVTLAEMVLGKDGLHEILWKIWKAMVPQWDDPRGSTLRAAAKGFAAGTVPPDRLAAEALSFKRFVMALLLGTQAFSKEYARDHLTRFSPDAIKSFANVGWGGKEKVYWLYYEEQMTKLGLSSADDHLQLTSLILDQLGQNVRAYLGNK